MHNKRKSVATERIIRILKTNMFKYMTVILKKNVYFDQSVDMVNK